MIIHPLKHSGDREFTTHLAACSSVYLSKSDIHFLMVSWPWPSWNLYSVVLAPFSHVPQNKSNYFQIFNAILFSQLTEAFFNHCTIVPQSLLTQLPTQWKQPHFSPSTPTPLLSKPPLSFSGQLDLLLPPTVLPSSLFSIEQPSWSLLKRIFSPCPSLLMTF